MSSNPQRISGSSTPLLSNQRVRKSKRNLQSQAQTSEKSVVGINPSSPMARRKESMNAQSARASSTSRPSVGTKALSSSTMSPTKPTSRRNSSRTFQKSANSIITSDTRMHGSNSSFGYSGAASPPTSPQKRSSILKSPASTSTLRRADRQASPTDVEHRVSPQHSQRLSQREKGLSGDGSAPRVSELRRQVSQTKASGRNGHHPLSLASLVECQDTVVANPSDEQTVLTTGTKQSVTNPHIILTRAPNQRRRKKKATVASAHLGTHNRGGDESTTQSSNFTWQRNPSPKKSKSELLRKHLLALKKKKEKSPVARSNSDLGPRRSLLRNRRKLEKELCSNDIFHFVLHKSPLSDTPRQLVADYSSSSNSNNSKPNSESKSDSSKETVGNNKNLHRRMSLDRFLLMKRESERIVLEADINSRDPTIEDQSDTWQANLDIFSRSACASTVALESVLESQPDKELPKNSLTNREDETILFEEEHGAEETDMLNDSLTSLDIHDAMANRSQTKGDSATTMTEAIESQTLSLSLDDIPMEDDSNDSDHSLEQVKDFAVIDPWGRRGVYSGLISKSSGIPCGHGRLYYPDEGEIFEGQFVHGFWTGYGRCIYTNLGEDYTGTFLNNVRHGHGTTKYKDGRIFEGTYTKGIKTEGKMTYQDGSTYLGHWANGGRHGRGTYTFVNGSVFFGQFENDRIHGSGVLTWSNGSRYVGTWKDGLRHGHGVEYKPSGSIRREGIWKLGAFIEREFSNPSSGS